MSYERRGECIIWTGPTCRGYPAIRVGGKTRRAHRVIYEYVHGPQTGLDLHHGCGVRECINASHMEALTREEHMARHEGWKT